MLHDWIIPDWPAPAHVRAVSTTRAGGVSLPPYDSLNLGDHVDDDLAAVQENRQRLLEKLSLPAEPFWLKQIHGIHVSRQSVDNVCPEADASVTFSRGEPCVIMTADCLPVLFCDRAGTRVGAAHAGWRGLCNGVLEETVRQLECDPADLLAWLGPAIGPQAFEVGDEVRAAFMAYDPQAALAFQAAGQPGKWLADIFMLARQRLQAAGLQAVYGGGVCTYSDSQRFFSYRRDGRTGRLASLIWLAEN